MGNLGRRRALRTVLIVLAFAALIALAVGFAPAVKAVLQDAWDDGRAGTEAGAGLAEDSGLLPLAPEWLEYTHGDEGQAVLAQSDFPEAYDLRAEGLAPEVGDQSPFNTCWAFGALGSLESNALAEDGALAEGGGTPAESGGAIAENGALANGTLMERDGALAERDGEVAEDGGMLAGFPGYSEHHLAWFAYETQRSGSQEGEGVTPANLGSFDPQWGSVYHMAAGSPYLALSTLATWTGAEYEDAVPYTDNRGTKEAGNESWHVDEGLRTSSKNHLTDVEFLPTPVVERDGVCTYSQAAVDAVKRAIMEHGAVSVSYHAEASSPGQEGSPEFFNYDTWASCVAGLEEFERDLVVANHVTTIVGWDDAYSKDNFVEEHRPAEDGAWIVQNSWGTGSWGLPDEHGVPSGCFYLSYYDETACEFASFQGDAVEDGFEYERAYQHDYLGLSAMLVEPEYVASEASTANVFVAEGDEELAAVSAVTLRPEASVEVEVYALDEDAGAPDDGRLVSRAEEAFDYCGYHTVELDEPVDLAAGERFAVIETIRVLGEGGEGGEDAESAYQVYFENAPADEEGSLRWTALSMLETTVRANAGESYRYDEGAGWRDVTELGEVSCAYDAEIRVKFGNALIKGFARGGER